MMSGMWKHASKTAATNRNYTHTHTHTHTHTKSWIQLLLGISSGNITMKVL